MATNTLQRPRASATRPAPAAAGPDSGHALIRVLLVAGVLAITGLWWVGTPASAGSTPGTGLLAIGELAGLQASFLVLAQLLLVARVPWFERAVGFDRLVSWHRSLGTTVVLLVVGHVAAMIGGAMLIDHSTPWGEVGTLLTTTPKMLSAIIGAAIFLVVGLSSARLLRRRLSYEVWFVIHLLTYGGIYLAFGHQIAAGVHFVDSPLARAAWIGLYAATGLAVVWWRFLKPLVDNARAGLRVDAVRAEATGTTSVWLRGRDLHKFGARGGQFFLLRFVAAGHLVTAHPYSMSLTPRGDRVRFTIGMLGDHSRSVAHLAPGTRVLVEGPFGRFTSDRARSPRVLLVAGGVGIGPVRALAEELVAAGRDVVVLHRAHSIDRLALGREFPESSLLHYVPLTGRRAQLGYDPLAPANLRSLVPDVASRDVFVCGPPAMIDAVARTAHTLGVPRRAIHHEELSLS